MPTIDHHAFFKRILINIDVTTDCAPALESGAALAAQFNAELVVRFVDDKRLTALETHPQVRTLDLPTGLARTLEPGSLHRDWRAFRRRICSQVARLGRRHQVLTNVESLPAEESEPQLRDSISDTDLFIVGGGRAVTPHFRLPSRQLQLAKHRPASILVMGEHWQPTRSVAVVYDGSQSSQSGLETALSLSKDTNSVITLVMIGTSQKEVEHLRKMAKQQVWERGQLIQFHTRRISAYTSVAIRHIASNIHADLIVLPAPSDDPHKSGEVERLTSAPVCPVLIFHGTRQATKSKMARQSVLER